MLVERSGIYFDDMTLGQAWRTPARTITEADIVGWAAFSGDFHPLCTDAEFARATPCGRRPLHGAGVFAIASGLAWTRLGINEGTAMAFLGIKDWSMRAPVFAGDTIFVEQRVEELRPSRTTSDRGVVTFEMRVINQDGLVCQQGSLVLLWRRRAVIG